MNGQIEGEVCEGVDKKGGKDIQSMNEVKGMDIIRQDVDINRQEVGKRY